MKKMIRGFKTATLMLCATGLLYTAKAKGPEMDYAVLEVVADAEPVLIEPVVALKEVPAFNVYAERLYKEINFEKGRKLNKEVFFKALHGYLNLRNSGQLDTRRDILSVCDFSLSSNQPRLWVIDLKKKKVLFNTLVAHGQGSGEEFATAFSNVEGSHQSSMGFFVTASTYYGDKGYSLKLEGKDHGYNDQAFNRAIVIHAADYVSYDFIAANNRLGRSWGCPSLPTALNRPIIDMIKGGTALFIYSKNQKYLASSKWLKQHPSIDASEKMGAEENTMLAEVVPAKTQMDSVAKVMPKPKPQLKPIPAEAYFQ
ncbi:MAG: murein L,D-transpeptidase catalytic domain family protein [Taibaiella sp.]|nr:murein L,D-transpeptidase catalytic domain family protein [Taibaiella sp.]